MCSLALALVLSSAMKYGVSLPGDVFIMFMPAAIADAFIIYFITTIFKKRG